MFSSFLSKPKNQKQPLLATIPQDDQIVILKYPKSDSFKIKLNPVIANNKACNLYTVNLPRLLSSGTDKHDDLFRVYSDTQTFYLKKTDINEFFETVCSDLESSTFTYCYKSDGRLYLCKNRGYRSDSRCKHT